MSNTDLFDEQPTPTTRQPLLLLLWPRSLQYQLAFLFSIVIAVLLLVWSWFNAAAQRETAIQMLESTTTTQAEMLEEMVLRVLPYGEDSLPFTLRSFLEVSLVERVDVLNENGGWITGMTHNGPAERQPNIDVERLQQADVTLVERRPNELVIWHRLVSEKPKGWVRLSVSSDSVISPVEAAISRSTLVSLVFASIAIVLVTLFLRRTLRDLNRAADFAGRMSQNLGQQLPTLVSCSELQNIISQLNWASLSLYDQHLTSLNLANNTAVTLSGNPDGVVAFDLFGNVLAINPAAERLLGITRQQALGIAIIELLIPSADRDADCHNLMDHLRARFEHTLGTRLRLQLAQHSAQATDPTFPAEITFSRHEENDQVRFVASFRDISVELEAQQALEKSERRHRQVLADLRELVFRADSNLNWTLLNPAWKKFSGIEVKDSIGKSMLDLVHAEDRSRVAAELQKVLLGQIEMAEFELRFEHRSLPTRRCIMQIRATQSDEGHITGLGGIMFDDTARQQAERVLRDQLDFVKQLLDSVPNCIYVKDKAGRYLIANLAWEPTFGVRREECLGKTARDIFPYEQAHWDEQKDQLLIESGVEHRLETVFMDKQFKRHDMLVHKTLLRKSDGSISGILGVMTDLTEQKQAEHDILLAKDIAESANRAKGDFLSSISHEIRTPMQAIIGMTDLALETQLNEEQVEYITLIKQSSDTLLHLIDEILDFSSIDSGRLTFEETLFSVRDCLSLATRTILQPAKAKQLSLSMMCNDDVPDLLIGDSVRLRQILINLLTNAIKYTDSGHIHLQAQFLEQTGTDVILQFSVEDSGIGIAPEKQAMIFDAFTQVNSKSSVSGAGLGLALCTRLVGMMRGAIWVDSSEGQGSTFHFTVRLPLAHSMQELAVIAPALEHARALALHSQESSAHSMRTMLSSWRLDVDVAHNAASAKAMIEAANLAERPYRYIVMDDSVLLAEPENLSHLLKTTLHRSTQILLSTTGTTNAQAIANVYGVQLATTILAPIAPSELLDSLVRLSGADPAHIESYRQTIYTPHHMHVLLAEDNTVNLKLAQRVLTKIGHTYSSAMTGAEAVTLALSQHFDLILMDIEMPLLGGLEATRRIRQHEAMHGGHVPIIAMTAHALEGDRERCLASGMDDYIAKPLQIASLVTVLDRVMGVAHTLAPTNTQQIAANEAQPSEDLKLFNPQDLLFNLNGDQELAQSIIDLFLGEVDQDIARIDAAVNEGQIPSIQSAVHNLKGAVSNFGAQAVVEAARATEMSCRDGDLVGAKTNAEILIKMTRKLVQELGTFGATPLAA